MATIRILPETVQNKIAAGEVIERPASVVKELVENAIDAGATMVAVELEDGGHRLIRVSDDGAGMDEEDLVACTQRHATSKISDVDDIFRINTFGFRGEALPSIGSVSRMAIATCREGEKEGHELVIEAGKMIRVSPSAPRKGTRVEVRDIFFNTPARRKFLCQPSSESTRAGEVITRLALGNPTVGFRLQTNERITLAVKPAASQRERLADLFGADLETKLVPFANDITEGLAVCGFFARPPHSRRNSKDIYVLVNKRWIRYYGLAKAVADAFQGILPPREYPFAIVNIMVDPSRVDVNAHPAKEEVRFEQANILISGVKRAVREALAKLAEIPTAAVVAGGAQYALPPTRPREERSAAPSSFTRQNALHFPRREGAAMTGALSGQDFQAIRERIRSGDEPAVSPAAAAAPFPATPEPPPVPEQSAALPAKEDEWTADAPGEPIGNSPMQRVIGQTGGKYILLEDASGVIFIDPHALHERWNFDRLMEQRKPGASASRLLLPLEMHLSPAEAAAAIEAVPSLGEYGFEFSLPVPNRMLVTAAPDFIPPDKLENLLRQVLSDTGEAAGPLEAVRERLLASMACRMSVLLGKSLAEEEIETLLDRFFHNGQLPTCPHGRPTAIRLTWEELARRFKR